MLSTSCFALGTTVRCTAAFTDINKAAYDPSGVVFEIRYPDNTTTTYTYETDSQLVKDSVGNYHVDILTTKGGPHYYRFAGTGTGATAAENRFTVDHSSVLQA